MRKVVLITTVTYTVYRVFKLNISMGLSVFCIIQENPCLVSWSDYQQPRPLAHKEKYKPWSDIF